MDVAQGTLNRLGWSRPGKPDSVEYQARQGWDRLLDEVSALGFDGSRVEYSEFVAVIANYADEVIFSPESHNAPVQIMGPLESAGQRFDAVWFLGADDTRWPASGRPDPLLPLALQRSARMPHASAAIDSELALAVTRRLLDSAGECVFSYASQNEQGPVRPSPLLAKAVVKLREPEASEVLLARHGAPNTRRHSIAIEEPDPSVIPWPQDIAAGGASILKKQAACPFQSFAERRLGVERLEQPGMGLDPREQGNLVHTILENVFSENTHPEWRLSTRDDIVTAIATFRLDSIITSTTPCSRAPRMPIAGCRPISAPSKAVYFPF
jgi:ATP-dependent helicase/nuclease subunit B